MSVKLFLKVTANMIYQKLKVQSIDVTKNRTWDKFIAAHSDKKADIAKVDSSNTVISWHKVIVFEHGSANDNTNLVIQTRKAFLLSLSAE